MTADEICKRYMVRKTVQGWYVFQPTQEIVPATIMNALIVLELEKAQTTICPACGYSEWDGVHGHPYQGKRTPPKTLWCTGKQDQTNSDKGEQG